MSTADHVKTIILVAAGLSLRNRGIEVQQLTQPKGCGYHFKTYFLHNLTFLCAPVEFKL